MTAPDHPRFRKLRSVAGRLFDQKWGQSIFLVVVIWLSFGNSFEHQYNLDDSYYIDILPAEKVPLSHLSSVFFSWFNDSEYRPLTTLTLAVEQWFFGRRTSVFHFFNVVYYTLLCFLILRIFGNIGVFDRKRFLFLFVVLFALHPSHANVVASIKNREVILALMAGLSASWLLFRVLTEDWSRRLIAPLLLGILLAVAANLFKNDGIITLMILPAFITFKRAWNRRVLLRAGIPIAALFLLMILVSIAVGYIDNRGDYSVTEIYENPIAQMGMGESLPFLARGWLHYIRFLIVPDHYYFFYGYRMLDVTTWGNPRALLGALLFIATITGLLLSWKKWKPSAMELGGAMFLLLIFPYVFFMGKISGGIAVRYLFYASLGGTLFMTGILVGIIQRYRAIGIVITSVLLMIYMSNTTARVNDWKNFETLLNSDLPHLKESYVANRIAADYYFSSALTSEDSGRRNDCLELSRQYIDRSIRIYNNDFRTWRLKARIWSESGVPDSSEICFRKSLSLKDDDANTWEQYSDFAARYKNYPLMEYAAAKWFLSDTTDGGALEQLTISYIQQGKEEDAVRLNNDAVDAGYFGYVPHYNLLSLYSQHSDTLSMLYSFFSAARKGLENPDMQESMTRYVENRDIDSIRRTFPEFFNQAEK